VPGGPQPTPVHRHLRGWAWRAGDTARRLCRRVRASRHPAAWKLAQPAKVTKPLSEKGPQATFSSQLTEIRMSGILILSIAIQAGLIIHVIKTGRNQIWIWVL